jgi:hypothetical protein
MITNAGLISLPVFRRELTAEASRYRIFESSVYPKLSLPRREKRKSYLYPDERKLVFCSVVLKDSAQEIYPSNHNIHIKKSAPQETPLRENWIDLPHSMDYTLTMTSVQPL